MFNLSSIELTNFRSYRGTHSFEFPKASGLYYFTGENKIDELGSNGAGKSTFLDAIVWCLYGRTARGLKSGDVATWGTGVAGGTKVTLEITVGTPAQITRSHKPNGLWLNQVPVDQEGLEKYLRLNFESFMHSVLNSQFGQSFFSRSPTEKLDLFSDILNLNMWLEKSKDASKQADKMAARLSDLESFISREGGRKATIEADITDLTPKSINHTKQTMTKIRDLEERKLKLKGKFYSLVKEEGRLVEALPARAKVIRELEVHIKNFEVDRDKSIESMQSLSKGKAKKQAAIDLCHERIDKLRKLGEQDLCPTCARLLNKKVVKNDIHELESHISEYEEDLASFDAMLQGKLKVITKHKMQIDAKVDELQAARNKKAERELDLVRLRSDKDANKREHTSILKQLNEMEADRNPYADEIVLKQAALKDVTKAMADSQAEIDELELNYEAVSYWVKGFKQIRLHVIEQAFQALELEVNNSLTALGMNDWQITFDIERENKSGGITKGFVVFIKGPQNKEPVRWESWSGGETQRLQLAGDLGLANLIMQQAGLQNTIEFFDEPSTHLSKEGMLDLADLLYERATAEGKRIWIVDHAAITDFGEFTGVIVARKDSNGSSISYN